MLPSAPRCGRGAFALALARPGLVGRVAHRRVPITVPSSACSAGFVGSCESHARENAADSESVNPMRAGPYTRVFPHSLGGLVLRVLCSSPTSFQTAMGRCDARYLGIRRGPRAW